jgi:FkbM family methyltransferase
MHKLWSGDIVMFGLASAVYHGDVEQDILADYLPAKGFFVEVGAYHPFDHSLTAALESRGWNGILIEPIPIHAAALRAHRRARVFELACGSPERHGQAAIISVAGALSNLRNESNDWPKMVVTIATLDSIVERSGVEEIDFLSIDVEGLEIDVLRGFTFSRYRPRLILIEDFAEDSRKHRFMRLEGYKRVRRTGNNSWYVPNDTEFPISVLGRLQLLRKYYLSRPFRLAKRLKGIAARRFISRTSA